MVILLSILDFSVELRQLNHDQAIGMPQVFKRFLIFDFYSFK
jgi:hypothetical protein